MCDIFRKKRIRQLTAMENKTVSDELFTDGGGELIAEGEALEESAKRADAEEGTKRRRRGEN